MLSVICQQGYYSIIIHIFIDFNVNFIRMSVADTLDFISFFAFQCNGTTVLAEIHRVVMSKREMYRISATAFGDNFYQFLCDVSKDLYPDLDGIGSCTQNRYTYSSGSNDTKWCDHQKDLLDLCQKFYEDDSIVKSKKKIHQCTKEMIYELCRGKEKMTTRNKKRFLGVGAIGAIQFVHIASLLGLIPLHCYSFAELIDDKLGPPKFIRQALKKTPKEMSIKECNTFFHEVHCDFVEIWGPMMTLSLFENTLCELSRALKATFMKAMKKDNRACVSAEMLLDDCLYCDGRTNDVVFKDEQRGTVQNFFLVRSQGSDGACELRPMLVMKHALNWEGTFEEAHLTITNWCGHGDRHDKMNMMWDDNHKTMSLRTKMTVSSKLQRMMHLK